MNAVLLNPAIGSKNIGDQVIAEAVRTELQRLVLIQGELPTQTSLTNAQVDVARNSDLAVLGGTNILSSNMPWYRQWKIGPISSRAYENKVLLMGVGWWQYQGEPNRYTSEILRRVLSRDRIHSVRDEYTREKIAALGFSVVNTACPTMWNTDFSPTRGERPALCLVTLTDYNRDPAEDNWLIGEASKYYDRVIIWPQSPRDAVYARELTGSFDLIEPTLAAYDALLASSEIDYIGTRLHGGIRAMQNGHWGLITAVDNRAIEIGRDTGLPVHKRGDRELIARTIAERPDPSISIPTAAIMEWRGQFLSEFVD